MPGKYYVADEQESAGACVNWLRDNVLYPDDELRRDAGPDDVFARIDDARRDACRPARNGVIFTPWLNGERTPVDDHRLRGGWHNLSLRTTRADLVRAVLEGVAFNTRWLLGAVEKFVGRPFPWLQLRRRRRAVGRCGARSWPTCSTARSARSSTPLHANARGAALLAPSR